VQKITGSPLVVSLKTKSGLRGVSEPEHKGNPAGREASPRNPRLDTGMHGHKKIAVS